MAIKIEHFDVNGRDFTRIYSDSGRYVVRDGVEYSEACDPAEFGRTYTEGGIIPDTNDDAQNILNIILGDTE